MKNDTASNNYECLECRSKWHGSFTYSPRCKCGSFCVATNWPPGTADKFLSTQNET